MCRAEHVRAAIGVLFSITALLPAVAAELAPSATPARAACVEAVLAKGVFLTKSRI